PMLRSAPAASPAAATPAAVTETGAIPPAPDAAAAAAPTDATPPNATDAAVPVPLPPPKPALDANCNRDGIVISSKPGARARVGVAYAARFQAYIDDLERNHGA